MSLKHFKPLLVATLMGCATGCATTSTVATLSDRPEPGRQGESIIEGAPVLAEPYRKGVVRIGHTSLGGRDTNLQMAWIDRCAYVSSAIAITGLPIDATKAKDPKLSGVSVIDVHDPASPRQVGLLQDRGSLRATEALSAVEAPGRRVLAAANYENGGPSGRPWLSIYDASDCTRPRLVSEIEFPQKVHEITVSPNGQRVYGTTLNPVTGAGGLMVVDISDLANPRVVGTFGIQRPDGSSYGFAPHEISISPDETRIYAGVLGSQGGDLNLGAPPGMNAERLGPRAGGVYIIDNSDLARKRDNPAMRLVATVPHGGWHSVVQARIAGKPFLVAAGELGACPGSWPSIIDRSDERSPRIVGDFKLAMNLVENCPSREGIEAASAGILGRPGTAASHFNDVDDPQRTRVGLFPFMWAGLRIADLRTPQAPREVAYFKPGDPCMSHVRFDKETRTIWFTCLMSGFHVLAPGSELSRLLK